MSERISAYVVYDPTVGRWCFWRDRPPEGLRRREGVIVQYFFVEVPSVYSKAESPDAFEEDVKLVEQVAKAIYEKQNPKPWEGEGFDTQLRYKAAARAALQVVANKLTGC